MARIVFLPLPEPGHIYPTLPVARRLVALGHSVVYLTSARFKDHVESVNAAVEPLEEQKGFPQEATGTGSSIWYETLASRGLSYTTQNIVSLLSSLISKCECDLLLLDIVIGERYGFLRQTASLRARTMLFATSLPSWRELAPENLCCPMMIFCPEHFEIPQFRTHHPSVHYVEPSVVLGSESTSAAANGRPLVLAAFGTQFLKYRKIGQVLESIVQCASSIRDVQFAVVVGASRKEHVDHLSIGLDNVCTYTSVNQHAWLRKASAFITHGGLGSVKEAILHAVPVIAVPFLHDQPYNAFRIRHHKIGNALFPDRLSSPALESAIKQALAGSYSGPLKEMQAVFTNLEKRCPSMDILCEQLYKACRHR